MGGTVREEREREARWLPVLASANQLGEHQARAMSATRATTPGRA